MIRAEGFEPSNFLVQGQMCCRYTTPVLGYPEGDDPSFPVPQTGVQSRYTTDTILDFQVPVRSYLARRIRFICSGPFFWRYRLRFAAICSDRVSYFLFGCLAVPALQLKCEKATLSKSKNNLTGSSESNQGTLCSMDNCLSSSISSPH